MDYQVDQAIREELRRLRVDPVQSFLVELDRVCPREIRPEGFGLGFSGGWGQAAAILRQLPDGAGSEAAARALQRASSQGDSGST